MVRISRDELKAGDHIYTWRLGHIYAHHGIYVGENTVIHFIHRTGNFLDKIGTSSAPKCDMNPCVGCGKQSRSSYKGTLVVSYCLDCFLGGGELNLFEYNLHWREFLARRRGGTFTTAISDSPEEVVNRAKYLLEHNGFGEYHLLKNNCEDFAIYCKTSLVVKNQNVGASGQLNAAVGFMLGLGVFRLPGALARLLGDIGIRKDAVKVSVETVKFWVYTS